MDETLGMEYYKKLERQPYGLLFLWVPRLYCKSKIKKFKDYLINL